MVSKNRRNDQRLSMAVSYGKSQFQFKVMFLIACNRVNSDGFLTSWTLRNHSHGANRYWTIKARSMSMDRVIKITFSLFLRLIIKSSKMYTEGIHGGHNIICTLPIRTLNSPDTQLRRRSSKRSFATLAAARKK